MEIRKQESRIKFMRRLRPEDANVVSAVTRLELNLWRAGYVFLCKKKKKIETLKSIVI